MEVEFLEKFSKDIDTINLKSVKKSLVKLILTIEQAKTIDEISNLKKLKGHKFAFRIRIGDYRVGFFLESGKVIFARIVHRKDIYKVFP